MIGFLAEGGTTPPPARNNFGDTMSDGIAGPLALLIIVLLGIATVLLVRSMNRHLRRIPDEFPAEPPARTGRRSRHMGPAGTPIGAEDGEPTGGSRTATQGGPAIRPAGGAAPTGS